MRRVALNPYFSTLYVRKLQPVIQERLNVLLQRMAEFKDTDFAVNANCMYAALSNGMTVKLPSMDKKLIITGTRSDANANLRTTFV